MTPRGAIEVQPWYHDENFATVRSPDGNVLVLIPDAANSVRVQVEHPGYRTVEVGPAHPADSSIEKIVRALDDLRTISHLIRRSNEMRTIDQRATKARLIEDACKGIEEALVECVTGVTQ
jgi:hypothetical protein